MPQFRQLLNTVFMVTALGLPFPQVARAALVEQAEPTWSDYRLEELQELELSLAKVEQIAQADPREAEASRLHSEGIAQAKRSNWRTALTTFQQALAIYREIVDHAGEASTLNNIGEVNRLLGNYGEALDYYVQSLVITQEISDRATESKTLNNIGIVNQLLGNYPEALDYYAQSLVIKQEIGDLPGEARTLNNIGEVNRLLGNYSKALDYYAQSLVIKQEIGDRAGKSGTLNNIGVVNQLLGNYSEALDYYAQSLMITQEIGDQASEAQTLNNIGEVNRLLGNYSEALDYYAQSLMITQEIGDRAGEAQTLNNIGSVNRLLGNYSEALDYYAQSLVIKQEIGDRAGEAQTLNNIGVVNQLLGSSPEALDYYAQSLVITQESGDRAGEAQTLNNIGVVNRLLGNYSESLNYYAQSLVIKQEIGDRAGEAGTLYNIGLLFEVQEKPVLAIPFFKQTINIYEDIRSDIQSLDQSSQENFKTTIEDDYRTLADLLLQQNRVLEAQRVIDLLKVQELDDTLRGVRGNSSTASGVPLLLEEETLLAESQRIFGQGAAITQELGELLQIPLAELTESNKTRISALKDQQIEIRDVFLAFVASPAVQDIIDNLSNVAKQGDLVTKLATTAFLNLRNNLAEIENAALIYPLILDKRLELVLVTPNGVPTHYPITVEEGTLRETVFQFQQALRDKTSTPEPLAQQLYNWIIPEALETALEQQGIETILYAPDGILRYIPLAALHNGEQWLAERYRVNHITAASLTDLNLADDPEPLVLAGAFSQGNHGNFQGLPYAGIEVEELTKQLPSSPLLLNEAFSLEETRALMDFHTIVHLATHADFLVESPLDSFILFGNGDRLTLRELETWQGLYSNLDLVVLSACNTGVGDIRDANGEEILGFGYLMQAAGASAAMASLWPVSDGGTQILMTEFYQALKDGMGKAEALQHAQRTLINGEGVNLTDVERIIGQRPDDAEAIHSQLSHPYYWAPFILIGNGL